MKTTYSKMSNFVNQAELYNKKNEEENKFKYAIKRQIEFIKADAEKVKSIIEDLDIDLCSVDKDKNIIRDEQGNLKFTKEAMKERKKKLNELMVSEREVKNYISTFIPDDLTDEEKEAFEGFVIPSIDTTEEEDV